MIDDFYEDWHRRMQTWANGVYYAWLATTDIGIVWLCGHNPQKLLPDLRYTDEWYQGYWQMPLWGEPAVSPVEYLGDFCKSIMADVHAPLLEAFFPKAAPPQRFYIEGGHFDMQMPGTINPDEESIDFESPTRRNLTPYVKPISHKMAVVDIDYVHVETRILATLAAHPDLRCILLDIESRGGEIAGSADLYQQVQDALEREKIRVSFHRGMDPYRAPKVAKSRQPDYLKHDKTKDHRRGRR